MRLYNLIKPFIFSALIILPGHLIAGERVEQSLSATADGVVEIHNIRGNIKVIGWKKNKVEIKGELDDLAKKLIFETEGKVTVIRIEMPKKNVNHGDGSDLVIKIPKGNRLDFNGISTDVQVENITGGIDLQSVSGDLDVVNVKQQLYVNTVSGDITLKQSSGKAKLGTVSGDVDGDIDCDDAGVSSVSGDIKLKMKEYDRLVATSVSGGVWVKGKLNDSGETRLSSVTGDITLLLDKKVNASASVNTGPGGHIRNKMSGDAVQKVFPNQQKLKMKLGDGSGRIKIDTVNGTISLQDSNK